MVFSKDDKKTKIKLYADGGKAGECVYLDDVDNKVANVFLNKQSGYLAIEDERGATHIRYWSTKIHPENMEVDDFIGGH